MAIQVLEPDKTKERQAGTLGGSLGDMLGGLITRKMNQQRDMEGVQNLFGGTAEEGQSFAQASPDVRKSYLKQQEEAQKISAQQQQKQQQQAMQEQENQRKKAMKYKYAIQELGVDEKTAELMSDLKDDSFMNKVEGYRRGEDIKAKEVKSEAEKRKQVEAFVNNNAKRLESAGINPEEAKSWNMDTVMKALDSGEKSQEKRQSNTNNVYERIKKLSRVYSDENLENLKKLREKALEGTPPKGWNQYLERIFSQIKEAGGDRFLLDAIRPMASDLNDYYHGNERNFNTLQSREDFAQNISRVIDEEQRLVNEKKAAQEIYKKYKDGIDSGQISIDKFNNMVFRYINKDDIVESPEENIKEKISENEYEYFSSKNLTDAESQNSSVAISTDSDTVLFNNKSSFVNTSNQKSIDSHKINTEKEMSDFIDRQIPGSFYVPAGNILNPADKKQMDQKRSMVKIALKKIDKGQDVDWMPTKKELSLFTEGQMADLFKKIDNSPEAQKQIAEVAKQRSASDKQLTPEPLTEQEQLDADLYDVNHFVSNKNNPGYTQKGQYRAYLLSSDPEAAKNIEDNVFFRLQAKNSNMSPEYLKQQYEDVSRQERQGSEEDIARKMSFLKGIKDPLVLVGDFLSYPIRQTFNTRDTNELLGYAFSLGKYDNLDDLIDANAKWQAEGAGVDPDNILDENNYFYNKLFARTIGSTFSFSPVISGTSKLFGLGSQISAALGDGLIAQGTAGALDKTSSWLGALASATSKGDVLKPAVSRVAGTKGIKYVSGKTDQESLALYDNISMASAVATPAVLWGANRLSRFQFAKNYKNADFSDLDKTFINERIKNYFEGRFDTDFSHIGENERRAVAQRVEDLRAKDPNSLWSYLVKISNDLRNSSKNSYFGRLGESSFLNTVLGDMENMKPYVDSVNHYNAVVNSVTDINKGFAHSREKGYGVVGASFKYAKDLTLSSLPTEYKLNILKAKDKHFYSLVGSMLNNAGARIADNYVKSGEADEDAKFRYEMARKMIAESERENKKRSRKR